MPSKGQRVAKRQNQIRKRKRRGPGRASTQQFEAGPEVSVTAVSADEGGVASGGSTQAAAAAVADPAVAPTRRRKRDQQTAQQGTGSLADRFLAGELRHIGFTTVVILVLLGAATYVIPMLEL